MKQLFYIIFLFLLLSACGGNEDSKSNSKEQETQESKEKQLNISILLDLSDRISPQKFPSNPEHSERDIENIKTITEFFKLNMERLGAYNAKGKIRVFFSPPPQSSEINTIASKLNIDCSKMDNKGRKHIYESITDIFVQNIEEIYNQTIATSTWDGSDIWRFFKDDVKDFCIDSDTSYRNILIVFTDGYLYHKQSVYNNKNHFSYLLESNLKLYRKPNWKQLIEQNNFGIITERNDLENLEVLVLEVCAENSKNKIDEDIMSFVLKNWLQSMNVSHSEVYRSDLPANTKTRIQRFLDEK